MHTALKRMVIQTEQQVRTSIMQHSRKFAVAVFAFAVQLPVVRCESAIQPVTIIAIALGAALGIVSTILISILIRTYGKCCKCCLLKKRTPGEEVEDENGSDNSAPYFSTRMNGREGRAETAEGKHNSMYNGINECVRPPPRGNDAAEFIEEAVYHEDSGPPPTHKVSYASTSNPSLHNGQKYPMAPIDENSDTYDVANHGREGRAHIHTSAPKASYSASNNPAAYPANKSPRKAQEHSATYDVANHGREGSAHGNTRAAEPSYIPGVTPVSFAGQSYGHGNDNYDDGATYAVANHEREGSAHGTTRAAEHGNGNYDDGATYDVANQGRESVGNIHQIPSFLHSRIQNPVPPARTTSLDTEKQLGSPKTTSHAARPTSHAYHKAVENVYSMAEEFPGGLNALYSAVQK